MTPMMPLGLRFPESRGFSDVGRPGTPAVIASHIYQEGAVEFVNLMHLPGVDIFCDECSL